MNMKKNKTTGTGLKQLHNKKAFNNKAFNNKIMNLMVKNNLTLQDYANKLTFHSMNNAMNKSEFQKVLANNSNKNSKNKSQEGGKSKKIYTGQRGGKYYYKKVNNKMVKRYI